jgi:para-aminobenzoate synthetase component 2
MPHVAVIDNYDSFTYNLVQALLALGGGVRVDVFRNDAITVAGLLGLAPTHLVISPGPGGPRDAGVSMDAILALGGEGRAAVLGVCLGHQAMAEAFGGGVTRAARLMHGKPSSVLHDGRGVFEGLPSPIEAGRYHSLIVDEAGVPPGFIITARTREGEVMGMRHATLPIEGVQFHPESVLTPHGPRMLANFLAMRAPVGYREPAAVR